MKSQPFIAAVTASFGAEDDSIPLQHRYKRSVLSKRPSAEMKINHQALQLNTRQIPGTAGFVGNVSGSEQRPMLMPGCSAGRQAAAALQVTSDKTPSSNPSIHGFQITPASGEAEPLKIRL